MRICIAHKYYFPGCGTFSYVCQVTRALESNGHTVIPFTVAYKQTRGLPYSEYFVSPPIDEESTHYAHFRQTPLSMLRVAARAMYSTEAYRSMRRLIEEQGIDLLYVQNIYNYISPSIIDAAADAGIPVVMRISDFNLGCPTYLYLRDGKACTDCKRGLYRAIRVRCVKNSVPATLARVTSMYVHRWKGIYRRVNAFVTPSDFMRRDMIELGFAQDKLHHIPSPVDISDIEPRFDNDGYALYFGRVSREKGLIDLIDAANRIPEVRLVIAGKNIDHHEEELRQWSERLGVANVRFAGFKSGSDLAELISGSMFVVVPSICHDNAPMSVVESFACGKPVIGTRMGGIPEQIEGGCGLLVDPHDPESLARAIADLSADPAAVVSMGRLARERAATVYSPARHYARLMEVFSAATRRA